MVWLIVAYLYVGFWTGVLHLGQWKQRPTSFTVCDAVVKGFLWPISLPLCVLQHHPPRDFGMSEDV